MAKLVQRSPQQWIRQVFVAKAAKNGGVVRRKIASVKQYASSAALKAEVMRRGFHMVVSGDQYVILCNRGHCKLVC